MTEDVGIVLEVEVEAEVAMEGGISTVGVLVVVNVDVLLNRHSRDAVRKRGVRERNTESMARKTSWWWTSIPPRRKLSARHVVTALLGQVCSIR